MFFCLLNFGERTVQKKKPKISFKKYEKYPSSNKFFLPAKENFSPISPFNPMPKLIKPIPAKPLPLRLYIIKP
jgi:hypothetical protein